MTPVHSDPASVVDIDDETLVFRRRDAAHSLSEDVLGLLTGTFAASLGLHLLQASEAVTGGTAGLALLVNFATSQPFWMIFAVINIPFALLAIWKKGWFFTLRTIAAIALVSGWAVVHDAFFALEVQPLYGTLAGNVLAGIGILIVFRHGASLGGVMVIGLLVQERTGFRAGYTMMIFDVLIIASALFVMPWPNVLMSAAGAVLLNLVLALNHRPGRYIGH